MRSYLERFAIPILVTLFAAAVTGTWKLGAETRATVVVVIGIAVLLIVFLYEKSKEEGEDKVEQDAEAPRRSWFVVLGILITIGTLVWLFGRNRVPDQSSQPGTQSPPTGAQSKDGSQANAAIAKEKVGAQDASLDPDSRTTPVSSTRGTGARTEPTYIRAPKRSGGGGNDWSTVFYGDDGSDYPVLRARAELVLQGAGKSTAQIFEDPMDPRTYEQLFAGDTQSIGRLHDYCDGVVLGLIRSSTSTSDQYEGLFTTHLTATVKMIATSDKIPHEFVIEVDGAGATQGESKSAAEARAADKLKTDLSRLLNR